MRHLFELHISLAFDVIPPAPGALQTGHLKGGPLVLQGWLETRLGLQLPDRPEWQKIRDYVACLQSISHSCYARSLEIDPWGTAAALWNRREELRIAGWEATASESWNGCTLVRDMARAEVKQPLGFADTTARLIGIRQALDAGQVLPPHECFLYEDLQDWPPRWAAILERLTLKQAPRPMPLAPPDTDLRVVQAAILNGKQQGADETDNNSNMNTVCWARSQSRHAACETVAALLASEREALASTVVCCADEFTAVRLDGFLHRAGLPTMGARRATRDAPALQLLPLCLKLLWQPVDPKDLLDFLHIPGSPLPGHARRSLSRALSEQPGLGSEAWERTRKRLCEPERDPDGTMAKTISAWLDHKRVRRGQAVPVEMVIDTAKRVAHWALHRHAGLNQDSQAAEGLRDGLVAAAAQASALGALLGTMGGEISEARLGRLLGDALPDAVWEGHHPRMAGAPEWVTGPEQIARPFNRMIWLGLGARDTPSLRWSTLEIKQLREHGILLDDGHHRLSALRQAEIRGLCFIGERLLAISLPGDEQQMPHPLWLRIRAASGKNFAPQRRWSLETGIAASSTAPPAPWTPRTKTFSIQAPQPERPLWQLDPALLTDRANASASELEQRLGCPVKWTFRYAANLRESPIARLPADHLLKGNFCHQILKRVFDGRDRAPTSGVAIELVGRAFDERLEQDAAPLARPGHMGERIELREQLLAAARTLVETLQQGNYRIVGLEVPVAGKVGNRDLAGSIDCLVQSGRSSHGIIDFKFGSLNHYRDLLRDGRATQLATYAHATAQGTGKTVSSVAYLILSEGVLLSPKGSPIHGVEAARLEPGPDISEVWKAFSAALERADDWLKTGRIPARPLQSADTWPEGVELILQPWEEKGSSDDEQRICRYCEYAVLCGREGLS